VIAEGAGAPSPSSEGVEDAEKHGFGLEDLVEGERVVGATTA